MKYLASILVGLSILGFVASVRADDFSNLPYEQQYLFEYVFKLSWHNGVPVQDGLYDITTGDLTPPPPGTWRMDMISGKGEILASYPFVPSLSGTQSVTIPYDPRGYGVHIYNDRGADVLTIDISGSRVCNDNGVCDSDAGEDSLSCPTDCGLTAQADAPAVPNQQAAIASQGGIPGGLLLVVADIVIIGLVLLVDKRRRP